MDQDEISLDDKIFLLEVEDRLLSTVNMRTTAAELRVLWKEWIWTWVKEVFGSPVHKKLPGGVDDGSSQVLAVFLLSLVQEIPCF